MDFCFHVSFLTSHFDYLSHSYLIVYSLFYSQLRKPCVKTLEVKSFLLLTATGLMLLPETYLSLLVFYALHSQNKNESCAFIGLVGAPTAPALSFRLICFQYSL